MPKKMASKNVVGYSHQEKNQASLKEMTKKMIHYQKPLQFPK